MNNRIAEGAWHVLLHLRYDGLGALRSTESDVRRYTVGAIAVGIGFADVEERHINRHLPAAEQERHFTQKTRDRIRHSLTHGVTEIVRHEDRQRTERINILLLGVRRIFGINSKTRDEFDITQFACTLRQGTQQHHRHGCRTLHNDRIAGAYKPDGFQRRQIANITHA